MDHFCLVFLALCCGACFAVFEDYRLLLVIPTNEEQSEFVRSLEMSDYSKDLQVWVEGNAFRPFEILVSPGFRKEFEDLLAAKDIEYREKPSDIQKAMEMEKQPTSSRARILQFENGNYFRKFLKLDEINAFIDKLAKDHPNLVHLETIGTTHMGKPLKVVKVSSNSQNSKVSVWLDGGIHAREWISPATVLFILNKLLTEYDSDDEIRAMVDSINFYIMPVFNPDGYELTHNDPSNRFWRKNRRPKSCKGADCCEGVDLNRNFAYGFGGAMTSDKSCNELYRGDKAFSEPESKAVRDFILAHKKELKAFVSLHSYSQMWFYPYTTAKHEYSDDVAELSAVAQSGAKALQAQYGTPYTVGTAADILYAAGGGSHDWAKSIGIKYSYCLELRPAPMNSKYGFILPTNEIVPTGEETWAGLNVVFQQVEQSLNRTK